MLTCIMLLTVLSTLDDKLDIGNLQVGQVGVLPNSTKVQFYRIIDVFDDHLIVYFTRDNEIVTTFFFKDKDTLAEFREYKRKYGKNPPQMAIEFPKRYKVSGSKELGRNKHFVVEPVGK